MRTLTVAMVAALLSGPARAQQANQPAKPDPALKKLIVYVGAWSYEGAYRAGPLGPAGKYRGKASGEMILRGSFLEWRWDDEPGSAAASRGFEIIAYDATTRQYPSSLFGDDGAFGSATCVFAGRTATVSAKLVVAGKAVRVRTTQAFAPDLTSFSQKTEISVDGKSWIPFSDARFTKVKAAANK
jgi:hypothetical protein